MLIEVSKGELIDKITIFELKLKYMTDTMKLQNVSRELDALRKHEFATSHNGPSRCHPFSTFRHSHSRLLYRYCQHL